jgi:hypothetical protein
MKRCPECDFIYEDEQHQCDMDGTALVQDFHILPGESPVVRPPFAKPIWRQLALAVSIGVIPGLGLYVFKHQTASQADHRIMSMVADAPDSVLHPTAFASAPSFTSTIDNSGSKAKARLGESLDIERGGDVKSFERHSVSTGYGPTVKSSRRQMVVQRDSGGSFAAKKKIGSFLKKTGRFLKKPFKN